MPTRTPAVAPANGPDQRSTISRWLLLATLVAAALPSLEVSSTVSAGVGGVSFLVAHGLLRKRFLPRSLRALHLAMGLYAAGMVTRVVEAGINGGELVLPGIADLFTLPALAFGVYGAVRAALARHALSRLSDVADAFIIGIAAMTLAMTFSAAYLFDGTLPLGERGTGLLYSSMELLFLPIIVLLLLGPGARTSASRYLAGVGVFTMALDTTINVLYAQDLPGVAGNVVRLAGVPIALYAMATSFADYEDFARPGVREQEHRGFALFAVTAAVVVVTVIVHPSTVSVGGALVYAVAVSVRIALANSVATRLELLIDTQRDMAEALADADTPVTALAAGREACRKITRRPLESIAVSMADGDQSGSLTNPHPFELASRNGSVTLLFDKTPESNTLPALSQLADTLGFAVDAVSARVERIQARATADWRALSGSSSEVAFILDAEGVVTTATPNAGGMVGREPVGEHLSQLLGADVTPLLDGQDSEALVESDGGDPNRPQDSRWVAFSIQPGGNDTRIFTVRDATDVVLAELTDAVTGLSNLRRFHKDGAIEQATVVMFRIEGLSRINEAIGKQAGDELFDTLADRLRSTFRSGIDRLYRGEGPALLAVVHGADQADEWIAQRAEALARPFHGQELRVRSFVLPVGDSTAVTTVMRRLEMMVGHAGGADTLVRFSPELEAKVERRLRIETELAIAVDDPAAAGLEVHYQPIVGSTDSFVDRIEALVRWFHPELGFISPAEFIPVAEATGHLSAIDAFVLSTGLRDLVRFKRTQPDLHLQVNTSPVVMTVERLEEITTEITAAGLQGSVTIEIIESVIGDDALDLLLSGFRKLREAGIGLSCDDFGTGEANMHRLSVLPLTQVKLAGALTDNYSDTAMGVMVATIQSLGYEIVVENVETADQAMALTAAGAEYLQGWLISKSLPADELVSFIDQHQHTRAG